jgi:hypothetical protein
LTVAEQTARKQSAKAGRRASALGLAVVRTVGTIAVALAVGLGALGVPAPSMAQGFKWPWDEAPPRPREPVNRQPPAPIPLPPAAPMSPMQAPQGGQWMARNPICVQLEQRLAQESQRGSQTRDLLPRLENEIRTLDRTFQQGENQLERADCYDIFLFSKTLRNTKQCRDLSLQVESAKRKLGELETQRQQLIASSGRSYTDDITRELARNNCGPNYQQQDAGRPAAPGGSIWQDSEGGLFGGGSGGFGASQYATYRTVCVRLCDGYYFPVSFATLPQRFQQDSDVCTSKCAAPVELYYHPNPGGAMEQAVAAKSQEPYTKLKTAFRYRKEYVQGCSCKETEYVPTAGDTISPQSRPAPDRRAERPSADPTNLR